MPLSLCDATIPSYLQILGAVSGLIDKAETFCEEAGGSAEDIIKARLAEDMLPFSYQVKSTAVHSIGSIEGLRNGRFSPDTTEPPSTFDGLRQFVGKAISGLEAVTAEELEGFIGKEVVFVIGERQIPFVGEDFLLSFSQPNFYFHAATAYDVMRMKGVGLGKVDFIGRLRINRV